MPFPKAIYKMSDSPAVIMGRLYENRGDTVSVPCINTSAIKIPFGCGVIYDTATGKNTGESEKNGIILPSAGTQTMAGILIESDVIEKTTEYLDANNRLALPPASSTQPSKVMPLGTLLLRGVVGVLVDQDVKATDPVFLRFVAGTGISIIGSFRMNDDTAKAFAVSRAKFLKDTKAGDIAPLWIS